jgi:hypothetical protein
LILRSVTVAIAAGKTEAYWAWAREIVELWDGHGVVRAGGPYRWQTAEGKEMALWLTVHETEDTVASQFRALYADGPGRALIEKRPPLVEHTDSATYAQWSPSAEAPRPPAW